MVGLEFKDEDGDIISEAGVLHEHTSKEEIELMQNERLIGIVSNHVEGNWPSCYFDV